MTGAADLVVDWSTRIARLASISLVGLLSLALAGCYDMTTKVSFTGDGQAQADVDLTFPPEAKDIIAFYDSIMQLQPETAAIFGDGICKSFELFAAMNPSGPLDLRSKQTTTADKVSCAVSAPLGNSAEAADKLVMFFGGSPQMPGSAKVVAIEPAGERRLRVTIDFSRGTDTAEMMRTAMLGISAASGRPANEAGIERIVSAYGPFMVATGKLMGEKRGFAFVLEGVKVIETNGERSGNRVSFRWSWADFMQRVTKSRGIENKVYYAIIEY